MIKLSLFDFLKSGCLGPIQLGMTRDQVRILVGQPDDVGLTSHKYPDPQIWAFGDIEFHWPSTSNELEMIYLDQFSIPKGGSTIELDPWFIREGLSREQLEKFMAQENIAYSVIDPGILRETHEILETISGVQLTFVNDGNHAGLYSLSLKGK